jgi:hypothetical protein
MQVEVNILLICLVLVFKFKLPSLGLLGSFLKGIKEQAVLILLRLRIATTIILFVNLNRMVFFEVRKVNG